MKKKTSEQDDRKDMYNERHDNEQFWEHEENYDEMLSASSCCFIMKLQKHTHEAGNESMKAGTLCDFLSSLPYITCL